MGDIPKQAASYLHKSGTQYGCGDCPAYVDDKKLCVFHQPTPPFLIFDSCNYFMLGTPGQFGDTPMGMLTKEESGFARSNYGFSCKRCEEFDEVKWDCGKVDRDSPGDDQGLIHPDACCNLWQPDPVRANMPTEAFDAVRVQGPATLDV